MEKTWEEMTKEVWENMSTSKQITWETLNNPYCKNQMCLDPIVENVRYKLLERSNLGQNKYKTTLKENTKDNYLNHLQEEMMDACNYIQVLLQQNEDITQLCHQNPSDSDLGILIRRKYGR